MEEDKAAALYESLSIKGLGAARFKQGLGYGAGGGAGPENAAAPIAFKKAGADFSTEIENAEKQPRDEDDDRLAARRNARESARVVQSIADKLRGRSGRRERRRGQDTDSEVEEDERWLAEKRRGSDSDEERHERKAYNRRGRSGLDEERRDRRRRSSSEDSRKGPTDREGDSKRGESPAHGESSDEDRARERRIADRRKEDAQKAGKSGRSDKDRREKGRDSRRKERSEERRGRGDRSPRTDSRKRARSRSRDREKRGIKERSPDGRRDKSRDDRHSERHDRTRRKEEALGRSKDRDHHRHSERSSRRERSGSREWGRGRRESLKDKPKEPVVDYAELIRGYENMSAAEKLKARTKYALSQTAVKDSAKGLSTEWERYAFDATAPLDEDAQQDKYGDDTKAADDASHLINTGSTFGIAKAQAVREAEKQAAHDAAIFGLPVDRSGDGTPGRKQIEKGPVFVPGDSEEDEDDRPVIVEEGPQGEEPQADTTEQKAEGPIKVAVPSWKERALKAQQAKRDAARVAEPG